MRRARVEVVRAILLTSIFWLLLGVIVLFYFLDKSLLGSERLSPVQTAGGGRASRLYTNDSISSVVGSSSPAFDVQVAEELEQLLAGLNFDNDGPGADGRAIVVPKEKEAKMREAFKLNQFNIMASDAASINRKLQNIAGLSLKQVGRRLKRFTIRTAKEAKNLRCNTNADNIKAKELPPVSVIIVFHNEAFSTLLRTLHSVINRSPLHLLAEIILIDDKSERDYLRKPLELYIKRFPIPVRLVPLKERSGLIRARLAGSAMAVAKVLLFLDAHVEVTEGWLEPLVDRVHSNRKRVVAPIIDVISDDTFEYITASDATWGGFNWHLNFRWYPVPDREMNRRNWDRSLPIQTPTIAGGLFAIDRQFFYDIGGYDEGMQVWGGENLEISFRVWMCGGSLEIHPCSRVGHVFRKQTPYTFPGGTATVIHHNAARTAEVWMDDYKHFFYSMVPGARNVEAGDLTTRQALRKNLQCKSFMWYLETIYPEAPIPAHYHSIGQVMNEETNMCIDTMGKKNGQKPGAGPCHGLGGNQAWSYTMGGEFRTDEICLSSVGLTPTNEVVLEKCATTNPNPKHVFLYDSGRRRIIHKRLQSCLVVAGNSLELHPCTDDLKQSTWEIENFIPTGV